jgi:putative hydrolase of the HAD superfamily
MTKISCVLFDLGGVIINWDNSWLIQELCDRFQLQEEKVSKEFYKNLPDISIDKIGEKEFWHIIGKALESDKLMNYDKSILDEIFRKHVSLNNSIISLSRELSQKGITVGILSNTERVSYSVVEGLFSLDHFQYKFLSYKIGHVKPNPEIYHHVIENIPFPKEELFFIDDLKPNVESARSEGIDSVQYSDYDELVNECNLRKLL